MLAGLLNLGVNVLDKLQNHFVERYSKYFNSMISTVDFRALYDKELSRHHCMSLLIVEKPCPEALCCKFHLVEQTIPDSCFIRLSDILYYFWICYSI